MAGKRQRVGQIVFVLIAAVLVVVGLSYGSTLLFFKLHHLDLGAARPFTIWDYWLLYRSSPDKFVRISVSACAFGPYLLLLLLPIVLLLNKNQRSLHGDARFATLNEIKKAGLIEPKDGLDRTILVGKFKDKYLTYGGYQFVMLAAPTRSGKGVGVVIPNCLNYSDSLVVLDIKLENFDITSGYRAAHGQEVYLFCPFDEHGRTHRYNPLEYISDDPAARIGDIDAIGTALYSGGNENDKFWSENAKDLFRGLCLMVLEHPTLPKTLGEILRQASGKGKPFKDHIQEMLEEAQKEGRPYSSACVDALNRITNNSDNTLAGIVSTFNGPLLIFQNPRVDLATSANDFDLREVRRKKMTIYLGVTPDKLKDAAVIVNLFFDQLLNLNTRVLPQQDKSLKYQCLLILDEFTAIGRVAMIQQSISYQAGYNMRVLTIIQNKSQLEDKYGKSGALTLMANHALMIMFAPSPVVQSDANEYSEMLGYQTVKSKNKSRSFAASIGGQGSRSESVSDQRRALMLPQELKELGRWREIVSLENCKPILCDKIKYFEDPAFTARTNWAVPQIPVQDVDTFVAKLEDRRRDVKVSDLQDPNLLNRVAGIEHIPDLPANINELSDDELDKIVDDVGQQFVAAVVREPIDVSKFRLDEDQAAEIADSIFGSADDNADETAFEIEESPSTARPAPAEQTVDQEKQESLNVLAEFGFTIDENTETTDETATASETAEAANESALAVSEADSETNSAVKAVDPNVAEPADGLAGMEQPEQQTDAEQGINSDPQILASFGIDETADPKTELSAAGKQVFAAFGLESESADEKHSHQLQENQS